MTWKLACMLRQYRTYNPTVIFSKYEFNNKLLVVVTFFRVTLGVTWIQPIYICTKKKGSKGQLSPHDYKIE